MEENIVVGYGNGVQLFQRKAIIDLDRANDHSVTALLSLHIQQFTYLYQLAIVKNRDPPRDVYGTFPYYLISCKNSLS